MGAEVGDVVGNPGGDVVEAIITDKVEDMENSIHTVIEMTALSLHM